jgi:ferritin-like metal-binding protein YciE
MTRPETGCVNHAPISEKDSDTGHTAHAFSYEHMELAAYELLQRIAARAEDQPVVDAARRIAAQERAMAERLAAAFDRAVEASLREKSVEDIQAELVKYLRDAHSIEAPGDPDARGRSADRRVRAARRVLRRPSRGEPRAPAAGDRVPRRPRAGPSRLQSGAMRIGAFNIGGFFKAQPDTPVKLAGFTYAFEHLEIAGYELLRRTAERAGDAATALVANRILEEEHAMAERVAATWDAAVDASLSEQAMRP